MIKNSNAQCKIELGTGDVMMTAGVFEGQAILALSSNEDGHSVGNRLPNDNDDWELLNSDVLITASSQKSVLVLIESLMTSYIMAEYGTYPGEGSIPYDERLKLLHKFIYRLYELSDEPYKGGDSDEN